MNRLAVYCGSASPEDPRYIQLAYDVGKGLAARGIGVVYGGGRLGLMGATARGALEGTDHETPVRVSEGHGQPP